MTIRAQSVNDNDIPLMNTIPPIVNVLDVFHFTAVFASLIFHTLKEHARWCAITKRQAFVKVFAAAVAAILFYLYIFLMTVEVMPVTGASTRALQREALPFALFELLLPCGINGTEVKSALPIGCIWSCELPLV